MKRVRLKVSAPGGAPEWREFEVSAPEDGLRLAAQNGLRVLAIDEGSAPPARPARRFPLLLFTQELLALLDAGLNVVEALETLCRKETHADRQALLGQLLHRLREGKSLSDALQAYPEHFPGIYLAGVEASERAGLLPETLARFVTYQVQIDAIRKKVISSTIYPALLILAGFLVTLFLLGYVVPKFSLILEGANRSASTASQLLLKLGLVIGQHPALIWSALAGIITLSVLLASNKTVRLAFLGAISRWPLIRVFVHKLALARFYRTVSLLIDTGTPLLKALDITASLLPDQAALELSIVRSRVKTGVALSMAMADTSLLTPIAESLIKVGERSGKLADMMERAAGFLDEDLARQTDGFIRLFEPLLMAFIGIVIGAIVVLMYLPIFDLVGSF